MQKVLVTGGAGFIGSHLCEYLLNKGYKVTCLDNLITGSKKNIEPFLGNSNFEFVEADVCKSLDNLSSQEFTHIFHLASPASPIDYQQYPEETLLVNSQGALNILNLSKRLGARVLMTSTSEIYGDPLEHPQKETYYGNVNTFGPRSCYDESKRFSETASYVFLHKYDLDVRLIRIFNTYGPKMQKDDGRVVSSFINKALNGNTLKIDGDGSQTRSFCFVTDMIEGIYKAMFTDNTKGKIFNLGNPDEFTIKELAEKILTLINLKSEVKYSRNFRENDPMRRKPDITKAKNSLSWEPKISLDDGLQKTIEYYKSL